MTLDLFRTCALVALTATSVAAQEPATQPAGTPDAKVTVTIGNTAAPPDWELSVPVMVKVVAGTAVGRVSLRLLYPAKALKYTNVRATDLLKKAAFDVKAGTPKITGDDGEVVLTIQPAAGEKHEPLPPGTLAIVVFRVSKDAPEKTYPMTAASVEVFAGPTGPERVTSAAAAAAKFTVTPPGLPILSCFFYMH